MQTLASVAVVWFLYAHSACRLVVCSKFLVLMEWCFLLADGSNFGNYLKKKTDWSCDMMMMMTNALMLFLPMTKMRAIVDHTPSWPPLLHEHS